MNFFNRIRNFFASIGRRTPITQTANLVGNTPTNNNQNVQNMQYNSASAVGLFMGRVIYLISRIFTGAVTFTIAEHFVPELREKIPSLYVFVDILMEWLENLCNWLCNIIF